MNLGLPTVDLCCNIECNTGDSFYYELVSTGS